MRVQRFSRIALLMLIFSLSIVMGQAQETNLLTNPGFETGFRAVSGRSNPQVANGWERWVSADSSAPSYQQAPFYIPASAANSAGIIPHVRSGTNAQVYYSFFETHEAGIYQRVTTGISAGTELRFSIYGYVFSNGFDDLDLSEQPGGVTLRVGIDPTGGTDPFASSVVYNEPQIFYDAYREYNVIATAQGNAVTVFVRTTISEPVQNTVIYLDDAVLNVTPESQPQATNTVKPTNTTVAPTNTARPTNTTAPTNTARPTNTSVAPTNTTAPTNTIAPVNTATTGEATPTREVGVATNTTAPSNTPQSSVPTATTAAVATNTGIPATTVAGFPGSIIHTVRRGDTVGGIAVRYGSSVEAIIEANELDEDAFILVGQGLIIPVRVVPATETPSPTPLVTNTPTQVSGGTGGTGGSVYVVQRGDTLTNLAIRFNTSIATLVQLNGITNPNSIFVGQRLTLPSGQSPIPTATPVPAATATTSGGVIPTQTGGNANSGQTYVVQPNDTLYRISIRFNVSIITLANINGITNYNYIQIGQVLRIP